MEQNSGTLRRCAIYTRKSSEEGLAQDFNSLHAQREACESYISSQHSEGWRLISTSYGGELRIERTSPRIQPLGRCCVTVV